MLVGRVGGQQAARQGGRPQRSIRERRMPAVSPRCSLGKTGPGATVSRTRRRFTGSPSPFQRTTECFRIVRRKNRGQALVLLWFALAAVHASGDGAGNLGQMEDEP